MSSLSRPIAPQLPDRIDGVQGAFPYTIKEQTFVPGGVLIHEYLPLEYVFISELGNDLTYQTTYWEVDRFWSLFIPDKGVYERTRNKLLQQEQVVVDYTDHSDLNIYIVDHKHVDGLRELYKTLLDELRGMDRESINRRLKEIGLHRIDNTLQQYYQNQG